MTLDPIRELRDLSILPVAKKIVEEGGEAKPMLHVLTTDHEIQIAALLWHSLDEKQAMCRALATHFRDTGARALAFTSEVWMVTLHSKDEPAPLSVRTDPRRQECLCVFIATPTGQRETQLWPILRAPDGTIRWGDVIRCEGEGVESALWEPFWTVTEQH